MRILTALTVLLTSAMSGIAAPSLGDALMERHPNASPAIIERFVNSGQAGKRDAPSDVAARRRDDVPDDTEDPTLIFEYFLYEAFMAGYEFATNGTELDWNSICNGTAVNGTSS